MNAPTGSGGASSAADTPHRFPRPSSPTDASSQTDLPAPPSRPAAAESAATPTASSPTPGPHSREPSERVRCDIPGPNTVSMCAQRITAAPSPRRACGPHVPGVVHEHIAHPIGIPPRPNQRRAVRLEPRRGRQFRELDRSPEHHVRHRSAPHGAIATPPDTSSSTASELSPSIGQDLAGVRAERGRGRGIRERRAIEPHRDADHAIVARIRWWSVWTAPSAAVCASAKTRSISRTSAAGTPSAASRSSQCALGSRPSSDSNASVSSSRFRTRDALSANRGSSGGRRRPGPCGSRIHRSSEPAPAARVAVRRPSEAAVRSERGRVRCRAARGPRPATNVLAASVRGS